MSPLRRLRPLLPPVRTAGRADNVIRLAGVAALVGALCVGVFGSRVPPPRGERISDTGPVGICHVGTDPDDTTWVPLSQQTWARHRDHVGDRAVSAEVCLSADPDAPVEGSP